nr:MAG TPA: hypothetical protein [Caudoviricetes sp.]
MVCSIIEHLFQLVKYRYCKFLDRMERKRYEKELESDFCRMRPRRIPHRRSSGRRIRPHRDLVF